VNTTSKLDLASTQLRLNRRVRQVLETRPLSLDEPPQPLRSSTGQRTQQVLPSSHRAWLQRSLF
jgi:hypothetical protein